MNQVDSRLRLNDVLGLVYQELRQYASRALYWEAGGITLQTTDLVHEAYLRLSELREIAWEDQRQVMRTAVGVMRRVLIDHARARKAEKRRPPGQRLTIDENSVATNDPKTDPFELLDLHEALERLSALDPRKGAIVELRYFGGLTDQEVADNLGISLATVKRDWTLAKAWLFRELKS
jgi:RNA polymerase sigma factor (TIGR02999 family)